MAMTNAELQALLAEFGDHLPVEVIVTGDEQDTGYQEFEVDASNGILTITVEEA